MNSHPFIFSKSIRKMKNRWTPMFRKTEASSHAEIVAVQRRWGLWVLSAFSALAGGIFGLWTHHGLNTNHSGSFNQVIPSSEKNIKPSASIPSCHEVHARDMMELNRLDDDILKNWHKIHQGQVIVQAWNCQFGEARTVILNHQSPQGKYVFIESWPLNESGKDQAWKWKVNKFSETSKMHLFSDNRSLLVAPQNKTTEHPQQAFYRSVKDTDFHSIDYTLNETKPHVTINRLIGLDQNQVNSVALWMSSLSF